MRSTPIHFWNVSIFLILFLILLNSCADEDLYIDDVNPDIIENGMPSPSRPDAPVPSDSTEVVPTDTIVPPANEPPVIPSDTLPSNPVPPEPSTTGPDPVTPPETEHPISNLDCGAGGGTAGQTGSKVWCWGGITIPEYTDKKGITFNNKQLAIDSECYEQQVTTEGERLTFRVDPTDPGVGEWCSAKFNMRAEIRTAPWNVRHAKGTEEWFGWSYTFGNDYQIDLNNQWKFFQVHPGIIGESPQISLEVIHDSQFIGHSAGEVFVVNSTTEQNYTATGITPRAGETLDVVVHILWNNASRGLLQVWINGNVVYDKQVSTIYTAHPWGGNAKWGIYKWPWHHEEGVEKSRQQGITHLETQMGALRMITRKPSDPDYLKDSYSLVAPD